MRSPGVGGRKRGVLIWWGSWSGSGAGSGSGSAPVAWSARSFACTVQSAPAVTVWPIPSRQEALPPAASASTSASASEASTPQRSRKLRTRRTPRVGTGPKVLDSISSSSAGLSVESRIAQSVGPTGSCPERATGSRGKKPIFVVYRLPNGRTRELVPNSAQSQQHLPSYAQVIASSPTGFVRKRLSRLLCKLRPLIR